MRDYKVKLTPKVFYDVQINGVDVGRYMERERWHGMMRLTGISNATEIITDAPSDDIFARMFRTEEKPSEVGIYRITPSVLDIVVKATLPRPDAKGGE